MARKKTEYYGSDVEYENEEKTFQLTRGKLILIILAIITVLLLIIFISISIKNKKRNSEPKYSKSDFIKLEERMTEEAPIYISQKQIEIGNDLKIPMDNLLEKNGGSIDSSKLKATNVCNGYVVYESDSYKSYIDCGKYYKTSGYEDLITNTTKKTTSKDIEKPVISLIGDKNITIHVGEKYNERGFLAKDNIDGDITSEVKVTGNVDSSKAGNYTLTYSVSDKAGNKSSDTRVVNVIENITTTTVVMETTRKQTTTSKKTTLYTQTTKLRVKPTIILNNDNVTITAGTSYNIYSGYSAHDGNGTDITSRVKVSGNVNTNVAGTYNVTYSVTDNYGNSSSKIKTINVIARTQSYIKLQSIKVNINSKIIKKSDTLRLYVTSYYPTNATNKSIKWVSETPSVAQIDQDGNIKPLTTGKAVIKAYAADGVSATSVIFIE